MHNQRFMDAKDITWWSLIAALAVLPTILSSSFTQHVFILILLYASMAQAWNILGGYCGQISFGHSVFFGFGAYGAGMAVVKYGLAPWPGLIVGSILAAIVALLILYPFFKLTGHYFAIATFAIVEIFNRLFMVWDWVGGALGLDYPLLDEGWTNLMWYESKIHYYYAALILTIIVFGSVRWIERHRIGYYMRAVREGQETAESLGVNSTKVKVTALCTSAFLTALCGAFYAQYNLRVDPPMVMSLDVAMTFLLITILGGSGTLFGPFIGAMVLIPLQEYSRVMWGGLGGGIDLIVFGLIIIVVTVKQPQGVMGVLSSVNRKLKKRRSQA
jgi:branched-chain amino acid transport system permease protein